MQWKDDNIYIDTHTQRHTKINFSRKKKQNLVSYTQNRKQLSI